MRGVDLEAEDGDGRAAVDVHANAAIESTRPECKMEAQARTQPRGYLGTNLGWQ
jgi:hypothetical protein